MRRLGEAPHGSRVNIYETAVYMNNIHNKTVQWETRKKYCSIINMNIQDNEQFVTPTWLMTNKGFEALSVKCDNKGKKQKYILNWNWALFIKAIK